MHLDESTVAWFGWQLATGHGYAYDPVYHGPFQHEMLALIFMLFQPSQTSARLLAVILGTLIVVLPWFIRDYLGRLTTLIGALLLAVSPSFVYFGRFERDDTYMEFFTFLMVVFALRYIRDRRPYQLYGVLVGFALAFATKESIYIVIAIFGSFAVLFSLGSVPGLNRLRGQSTGRLPPPYLIALGVAFILSLVFTVVSRQNFPVPLVAAVVMASAVVAVSTLHNPRGIWTSGSSLPKHHLINATTIGLGVVVLMYSTFGTNLNGLWDHAHPFFNSNHSCQYTLALNLNPCRKDIIGGLFYWLSQHKVARGGQPWYYYLLIYGLYEQIALVFGAIALLRTLLSRTMSSRTRTTRVFFMYWAILAVGIYSWAGEKFPWLGIHPLLPLTMLAAFGISDVVLARKRVWLNRASLVGAAILLVAELHNTFELNYVNGANPVEMMVYVQSAPDTARDATRIDNLSNQAVSGNTLSVTIDSNDSWPFAWYLRNMPNVAYPTGSQAVKPPYAKNPIIILDQTDAETYTIPQSLKHNYARSRHRLDWWFPENYKTWSWASFGHKALDPNSWRGIWNWEIERTPFGPRYATWYYLYVKKGYFAPF